MPRHAREKSKSGIYHIMLRGSNRQEIFYDDEDRLRFLETLDKYKKKSEIRVYGWCLMDNHVHILLQEGKEDLAVTMKRVGVSFAWFYNWKYKTTGHLFQDRYRSEKIENDKYLHAVVRYIHQNPVKAGIVKSVSDWKWSSCGGYYGRGCYPATLLDRGFILDLFSESRTVGVNRFIEYNESENDDQFLDETVKHRLTDDEAKMEMKKVLKEQDVAKIKSLPKSQRDELVARVKAIEGLTQRQISRILGISLSLINRA